LYLRTLAAAVDIDVSVIVPAYRAAETLSRCLESLIGQRFRGSFEIVLVASADSRAELPAIASHPMLTVLERVPRLRAAAARNLGARVARGEALAFTDADVIAPTDWLSQLVEASHRRRCVAGSVANGTADSLAGTVEYLVEFFDLSPCRFEPSQHGASCNLLVPRPLWERYGPFPETMDGCEDTWLTARLLSAGLLHFAAPACVLHLNRQRMSEVIRHQYSLGGSHARLAVWQAPAGETPVRDGVRATLVRIHHLYRSLWRWRAPERRRALLLAPWVLATFSAWGAGLISESQRLRRAGIDA
jgi:GT2 family glycosyltransferase